MNPHLFFAAALVAAMAVAFLVMLIWPTGCPKCNSDNTRRVASDLHQCRNCGYLFDLEETR